MKLVEKILSNFKFDYVYFGLKLAFYVISLRGRMRLDSFSVSLERGTRLLVTAGSKLEFGSFVYIRRNGDIEVHDGGQLKLGDNGFINKNVTIICRESVMIGRHCLFGENVSIYDHNHGMRINSIPFRQQAFSTRPVNIGNNVWLGSGVTVCPGVTIGNNVVVGAGTIVTKDIPDDTIAHAKVELTLRSR